LTACAPDADLPDSASTGDTEVVTVWATDLDGHIALQQAETEDERIATWRRRSRAWTTRWHEELMTPHPGTPLAAELPTLPPPPTDLA